MRRWIPALLAWSLLAPGIARGAGVYGPSGLFLHTTAYLPPRGGPTAGATVFTQARRTARGDRSVTWTPVFLDGRAGARGELGAVYLHQRFAGQTLTSYGGFGKYQLLGEAAGRPALALDFETISGDLRQSALN